MSYARFEALYADVLRAADPVLAMREAANDGELDEELRAAMRDVDEDGLRMSALLVAKLRFERLMNGSLEADRFFEAQPAEFTAIFRRYHAEVPMTAFFPSEEGALFAQWCRQSEIALGA